MYNPEYQSEPQDAFSKTEHSDEERGDTEEKITSQKNHESIEPQSEHNESKPEAFAQSEELENYQKKNSEIKLKIQETIAQRNDLEESLTQVRTQLYEDGVPEEVPNPSLDVLDKKLTQLQFEKIKASSNYPGDWTLLLRERMLDPVTKEKFVKTRQEMMKHMKQGETPEPDGINLIKPKSYASHYQKQIDEYDANVERIFSKTHIGLASEFDKEPRHIGSGRIGEEGNIFTDGQIDGRELTVREKNIIEAHEKGHGLRDFVTVDQYDFEHALDHDVIHSHDFETGERVRGYLLQAEEIAERMAQLKNYFGLGASDVFTLEHLKFAKRNYVKDTGLDNSMSLFFDAVTENTQDVFIETINKYPL